MSRTMRALYTLLTYLSLPLLLTRLLWRSLNAPQDRRRLAERLGVFQAPTTWGGLWIHAASVGEVRAAMPLIHRLLVDHPGLSMAVTTMTPGGSALVRERLGGRVFHVYLPVDLPFALRGFLRRLRPRVLLMIDTRIRPNLLHECQRHNVYTLLGDARVSAKSASCSAWPARVARGSLRKVQCVATPTENDAQCFRALGVAPDRVTVTGSIAFDMLLAADQQTSTAALRFKTPTRPVWVAGGLDDAEEKSVLAAHRRLLASFPNLLLILVPSQPECVDRLTVLGRHAGLAVTRCSDDNEPIQVCLGDTVNELPQLLEFADIAFIGGSLGEADGHSVLGAAARGVALCCGPQVSDCATLLRALIDAKAAVQVADEVALAAQLFAWFDDDSSRAEVAARGRRLVEQHRGALRRLIALLPIP